MTVLGVDFGGTKVAAALADDHLVLESVRRSFSPGADATVALAEAAELIDELLRRHAASPVVLGVATPGIVAANSIALAPNLEGWESLALADELRSRLGIAHVTVANDVKAAALAEYARGVLRGVDVGLYVNLGTGIAAALVCNGAVLQGSHGAAGEIGYAVVGGGPRLTWEAGRAPLEELAGGGGLGERGAALFGADGGARGLFAAESDHPGASELIDQALDELARHLVTCCLLADPSVVVIGGGMAGSWQRVGVGIAERLHRVLPLPVQVERSAFGSDASLHGAIEVARRAARGLTLEANGREIWI